jgi:hypothetical protein
MTSKGTAPSASRRVKYEMVVRGEPSERFATTFLSESLGSTGGPARVEPGDRTTAIVIEVIDQTHLLAVLERLRDLSLEIERVNPVHESAQHDLRNTNPTPPPAPTYTAGMEANTTTLTACEPRGEHAEMLVTREEEPERRRDPVAVLGSGRSVGDRRPILGELACRDRQGVIHPPAHRPHGRALARNHEEAAT